MSVTARIASSQRTTCCVRAASSSLEGGLRGFGGVRVRKRWLCSQQRCQRRGRAGHRTAWHPRQIAATTPPPSRAAAHRQRRMTCTLAYTPSSPLAPPMALLARLSGLAAAIPGPLQLPFVSCRGLAGCRGPRGGWRAG